MEVVVRQIRQAVVGVNTDRVLHSMWIPAGGKFLGATINVHCMVHDVNKSVGGMYGANAFQVPVDDPDATIIAEVLWDRQVPKDIEEAPGAFDLDTGTALADPEFAIGEVDIAGIFDYGPREMPGARRRKLITFANSRSAYEGSTVDTYSMLDTYSVTLGEQERVDAPHAVLYGFSSPSWDETQTLWTSPAEDQWINLMFPRWTMEQALVELLGQVETGAESPFEDASAFLLNHIEPDAVLETTGSLVAQPWTVFSQATMVMDVPGTPSIDLDSEG